MAMRRARCWRAQSVADRIETLERRLASAEDELAVIRVLASYGPLVDTGLAEAAPGLFADDGVYDTDLGPMHGARAIAELFAGEVHQKMVARGIGHVVGLPMVTVDGDRATAVCPAFVFLCRREGYGIWRVSQNVWELKRIDGGWKVVYRTNRLVDGSGEARALLERAISGE